jgi:hypothetical protein
MFILACNILQLRSFADIYGKLKVIEKRLDTVEVYKGLE